MRGGLQDTAGLFALSGAPRFSGSCVEKSRLVCPDPAGEVVTALLHRKPQLPHGGVRAV